MSGLVDKESQRKMAAQSLLLNSCYKEIREELDEVVAGMERDAATLQRQPISYDKLSVLNFNDGKLAGLLLALSLFDLLKEELEDKELAVGR